MKKYLLIFLILFQIIIVNAQQSKTDKNTEKELIGIAQELLDAVGVGDKAVWDKHLDEKCLVTTEDGEIKTKAQMIEEISPLPKGYKGSIEVIEPKVIDLGNVAIIKFVAREHLELFEQVINTKYIETDTYIRSNDKWKLVASQIMELNFDPNAVKINKDILKNCEGKYQLTTDITYTVSIEGDKIFGQRGSRPKEELIPASETVFFRKGTRIIKIFEKDEKGNVTRMLDRRSGNDLIWKKIN